jgi:photosystem II stability/assembly factor-like uncharacterized protein
MKTAVLLGLALAGCYDAPFVLVTVDTSGAPLAADQLHITSTFTPAATNVPASDVFDLPAAARPLTLPTRFTLQLPGGASGVVEVAVEARAAGQPIATGSNQTRVAGNGSYSLEVTLGRGADGGVDLSPADLAGADLAEAPTVWVAQALPSGTPAMLNVWGSGPNDVYAVGYNDTILHTTDHGVTWTRVGPTGTADFTNVWGANASAIVAVGLPAAVVYSSAGAWPAASLPAAYSGSGQKFLGVWGTSATDVYAVGSGGAILHSTDRQHWTGMNAGTNDLFSIWGAAPNDLFAVGAGRTLLHSTDGALWQPITTNKPITIGYTNIWGSGANNIFIVGDSGTILRSSDDGASWTSLSANGSTLPFDGDWGTGDDVFVISGDNSFTSGSMWHSPDRGASWTNEPLPNGAAALYGVWGTAYDDVYAAGGSGPTAGIIYHRQRQ